MRDGNEGSRNSRRGRNGSHKRAVSLCGARRRKIKLGNSTSSSCRPFCDCGISIVIDNRKYLQDQIKQLRKELMN